MPALLGLFLLFVFLIIVLSILWRIGIISTSFLPTDPTVRGVAMIVLLLFLLIAVYYIFTTFVGLPIHL